MTRMNKEQAPGWLYYVNVEDMDAALARVMTKGTVAHGPSTVATGQRVPQGAVLGMVGRGEAENS